MLQIECSLKNHQELVELIHAHYDENGICKLSQKDMAVRLKKSQSWVAQAIKRINTEKTCIEKVSGGYKVRFTDLEQDGTFAYILELISLFLNDPISLKINEKELAECFSVKRRTIQAAKAYYNDFIYQHREKDSSQTLPKDNQQL